MYDLHVHTRYSDGDNMWMLKTAAEELPFDTIGFVDHAIVTDDELRTQQKYNLAHVFDKTYQYRRKAIEFHQRDTDVEILDGIEMDFQIGDESRIAPFLAEAEFEYTIGSVHTVHGTTIPYVDAFEDASEDRITEAVEEYYAQLEALIRSELFDIAAHVDLIETTPHTYGRTNREHAERIADAFEESRTVPEINVKPILEDSAIAYHPADPLRSELLERNVPFTLGSDAHSVEQFRARAPKLEEVRRELDAEIVEPERIVRASST